MKIHLILNSFEVLCDKNRLFKIQSVLCGRLAINQSAGQFGLPQSCPSASQVPRRRAVDGYINNQDSSPPIITNNTPRDWSLITGRGATKWENYGSETFAPPSQDRVKLFAPPPPHF